MLSAAGEEGLAVIGQGLGRDGVKEEKVVVKRRVSIC